MSKNKKRFNKDPVFDPNATVYVTGVSLPTQSRMNTLQVNGETVSSIYHEVYVDIDRIGNTQTAKSYVDVSMDNFKEQNWPNRIKFLNAKFIIGGRGVLRQNKDGDVYLDCDHFHPDMVYSEDGTAIHPDYPAINVSTNNHFTNMFSYE